MSSAKSIKRKAASDGARTAAKKPSKPKGMVELVEGHILTDLTKKRWRLGRLIGWGGFGALYLAAPETGAPVTEKAEFVAKIEPHTNGPLFSELAFYQRVAKPELIQNWMKSHKLKHLGVPEYIGSGSLESESAKMRFMIMERFSHDVDKVYQDHSRCFDIGTTLTLGLRIIEALEYIHSNEYVHADIKGSNLMLGFSKGKTDQTCNSDFRTHWMNVIGLPRDTLESYSELRDKLTLREFPPLMEIGIQKIHDPLKMIAEFYAAPHFQLHKKVYLMDYGLAYRFNPNGNHKAYKEDPKRRHDGTVEFTSRDAHNGVAPARRGDLEILGYVMLQWLCNRLPWEDNLNDKEYVKRQKIKYMDNVVKLMKDCGLHGKAGEVQKFLEYIITLEYDQEPDYHYIKKLFRDGLKKHGAADDGRSVKFKRGGAVAASGAANGRSDYDEEEEDFAEVVERPAEARVKTSPQKKPRKKPAEEKSAVAQAKKPKPVQEKAKPRGSKGKAGKVDSAPEEKRKPAARRPRGRKPVMVDSATSPINWRHLK